MPKSAIVQKFKISELEKELGSTQNEIIQSCIETMAYVGEQCVKQARDHGNYNDITGNLRSSIGYVVLRAGKPVVQGGSKAYSGSKGNGQKGISEGGVATSISTDKVNDNIKRWCADYGLNAEDYLDSLKTIENGSNLW